MKTLFYSTAPGTKVHIDYKRMVITILQEHASYKIPYAQITCSYLVDSSKKGIATRIHCVHLRCLKDFELRGCDLNVKYADGWRGMTAVTIAFGNKTDVDEFLELITLARKH